MGFVLRGAAGVLLGRRIEGGLFGGMWEPPYVDECAAGGMTGFVAAGGRRLRRVGDVTHVLSHRRIEMRVYGGPATQALLERLRAAHHYETLAWVPAAKLGEKALTSLARKVLAVAGVAGSRS